VLALATPGNELRPIGALAYRSSRSNVVTRSTAASRERGEGRKFATPESPAGSGGRCNTRFQLLAGVWKPGIFLGL